jgi:transposase-like protein
MHTCPHCQSEHVVKNGMQPNLKQSLLCRTCGKRFVEDALEIQYSDAFKALVFKALEERVSLRGIQRLFAVRRQTVAA